MTPTTHETALVTGASSGIGAELAREFAADGYDLVLTARREGRLESLAEELEAEHGVSAHVHPADLTDPDAPQALYDELQAAGVRVDALVNNAGFSAYGRFDESDLATELDMLRVNVVALTELAKLFGRPMVERGHGEILNTASMLGIAPTPNMAVYAATKSYILSFSEAIAHEFADEGVTVTALCPGPVDTELLTREEMTEAGVDEGPLYTPETVARAGYEGLKDSERVVVPGTRMKLLAGATRVLPRKTVTAISGAFNA